MQALPENNLWDAELDGRMVAILGINRIATAAEFSKIINNIDVASWTKKQAENWLFINMCGWLRHPFLLNFS